MGQVLNPKGTTFTVASGTTLTIPKISCLESNTLIVAITSSNSNPGGDPGATVVWNGVTIPFSVNADNTSDELAVYAKKLTASGTGDLVITWPLAVTLRLAIASEYTGLSSVTVDTTVSSLATSTTMSLNSPAYSSTKTLTVGYIKYNNASGRITSIVNGVRGQVCSATASRTFAEVYRYNYAQPVDNTIGVTVSTPALSYQEVVLAFPTTGAVSCATSYDLSGVNFSAGLTKEEIAQPGNVDPGPVPVTYHNGSRMYEVGDISKR